MSTPITLEEMARELDKYSSGEILAELHRRALKYSALLEKLSKHTASRVLTPRTGHLVQSIKARPTKRKNGTTIRLQAGGGPVKYAKVHEQDGEPGTFFTIKPKKGKYLVFPVSADAFTEVGVDRGDGEATEYAFARQVRIPARPFLRPSWIRINKRIEKDLGSFLTAEVIT